MCTHTRTRSHTQTCAHNHTRVRTLTHTHIHVCTQSHTNTHAYIHTEFLEKPLSSEPFEICLLILFSIFFLSTLLPFLHRYLSFFSLSLFNWLSSFCIIPSLDMARGRAPGTSTHWRESLMSPAVYCLHPAGKRQLSTDSTFCLKDVHPTTFLMNCW